MRFQPFPRRGAPRAPLLLTLLAALLLTSAPASALPATPAPAPAPLAAAHQIHLPLLGTPQPVRTSAELIDEALARGELDAETALLYKVFAQFADPRLPASYRGDDREAGESAALGEAQARFAQLSPSARAMLAPFFVPPFHVGSWWQLRHSPAPQLRAAQPAGEPPLPIDESGLLLRDWGYVNTLDGKAKIWWQRRYPEDEQKAIALADALAGTIWPALHELMGREPLRDNGSTVSFRGGDDRLDIALADLHSVAFSYGTGCGPSRPAYLLINRSQGEEARRVELAHELMHAFQFAYNTAKGCPTEQYGWLMESTAQWAMDFVYPVSKVEHMGARRWMAAPERSIDTLDNGHHYGVYLFWLYFSRILGQPEVIAAVWENTERYSALEAVDRAVPGGFAEAWPKALLQIWNQQPVDDYRQQDGLNDSPITAGEIVIPVALGGRPEGQIDFSLDLPFLAAKYYHFSFDDPNARQITFYNGIAYELARQSFLTGRFSGETITWREAAEEARRGLSIQALAKIGGVWQQLPDWTDEPFQTFCRDNPAERLEELVLIFGNSEWRDTAHTLKPTGLKPTLMLSNIGCWRYTSRTSVEGETDWSLLTASLHEQGATTAQGVLWEREPVEATPHWDGSSYLLSSYFKPVQGTVSTSWTGSGSCGFGTSGTLSRSGSGPVSSEAEGLEILSFSIGGDDHRGYAGAASSSAIVPVTRTGCFVDTYSEEEEIGEWFMVRASGGHRVGPEGQSFAGAFVSRISATNAITYTWNFSAVR